MACLRLVTFLPDLPLFSVPFFRRRMALFTVRFAFDPYFAMTDSFSIGDDSSEESQQIGFRPLRKAVCADVTKRVSASSGGCIKRSHHEFQIERKLQSARWCGR